MHLPIQFATRMVLTTLPYRDFADLQQSMSNPDRFRLSLEEGQEYESDLDVAVIPEKDKKRADPPSMYQVMLLNDDYTPMDFVIDILEKFFNMPTEKATQTMLKVHTEGAAVCGIYTRDVAETKSQQVNHCARENQHPLLCKIQKAD
ncbi:ATP-dependent Clp protease adapter protein ClpS [invertebrate metagenome]|uniref:ATP-dependent Clp protease adapter protein ClpS n=1 Tax=invertebrate metagenome TaxID=1711999 RepID=A0A2H9T7S3_9ZZZZ